MIVASPVTPPDGIVTFLFTDIEGSTRLWERDPAAMWAALGRHNAILGNAIAVHGGCHFKTVGDAFQAAFADPAAAVAACVQAQHALAVESWPETGPLRVRMALHRGPAEPSASGDYLAPGLNRLARLIAAGHGGQILLSAAMHEATDGHLPDGTALVSLGKHRLRDLLEAEEVWQLVIPGLPATFPPLKSLEGHATNLPQQPTPLIGRDEAVAALRDLLAGGQTRLLTLTGPGGIGKTRLALATAADSLDSFPDGVFLVSLAGVEEASLLLPEIAAVLGVREGGGLTLAESLGAYLREKRLLLLLDNLEQVRPFTEAASIIAAILQDSPGIRVLATSRAPLRVRAEQEWPVPPLPIPAEPDRGAAGGAPWEEVAANPAVALFVDRAQEARPAWTLTREHAPAVAEIARRLEGVPLAIELAAARIRVLSPAEIVRRLGDALDLLAARAGDRPDRQQTLRGAIAWSHDLLDPGQQAAFRRLGVFSGGATFEAADAVLVAVPDPEVDALDAVSILVEQSLLRVEEDAEGETRYRMLETIRAFALEKLAVADEEEPVRRAHAVWLEAFARDADRHMVGPESPRWLERSGREFDNARAAAAWAIERDPGYLGLRVPEAMWRFWELRGHYAEARRWLERALEAGFTATPALRALTLEGLANIAWRQGDLLTATTAFEEALGTWRATQDRARMTAALANLGAVVERRGDYDRAERIQEEGLAIAREVGDPLRVATILNNLATVVWNKGDGARATALLEESVAIKRREGNLLGLASSLSNLGMLAAEAGDLAGAIRYMDETLAIDREVGNKDGIADSLGNLAALTAEAGDTARAAALDVEALELRRELGDRLGTIYSFESLATTAAWAGRQAAGARLFGMGERLREEIGAPLQPNERERYERGVALCRDALPADIFRQEWAAGRHLSLDEAIVAALAIAREIAGSADSAA
jgi:predicted ATPase/class 3 adenylate cyclase/Tfp pilus assembly protein PilF